MTLADLDAVWWSACIGCALWGAIVTAVCGLMVAGVVRLRRQDRREERQRSARGL